LNPLSTLKTISDEGVLSLDVCTDAGIAASAGLADIGAAVAEAMTGSLQEVNVIAKKALLCQTATDFVELQSEAFRHLGHNLTNWTHNYALTLNCATESLSSFTARPANVANRLKNAA